MKRTINSDALVYYGRIVTLVSLGALNQTAVAFVFLDEGLRADGCWCGVNISGQWVSREMTAELSHRAGFLMASVQMSIITSSGECACRADREQRLCKDAATPSAVEGKRLTCEEHHVHDTYCTWNQIGLLFCYPLYCGDWDHVLMSAAFYILKAIYTL